MRLQKHMSRKVRDKEYAKFVVVIPSESVEKLGWRQGQELEEQIQGKKLVLTPKATEKRENQ